MSASSINFNPQGSREPRRREPGHQEQSGIFQSTRLSRASTPLAVHKTTPSLISIHKALASLDPGQSCPPVVFSLFQSTRLSRASTWTASRILLAVIYFNPQGSREPRHGGTGTRPGEDTFQSTRLSRASTWLNQALLGPQNISIHKALASLD